MPWTGWRRSEIICEAERCPRTVNLAGLKGVEVQSVPHNGEKGSQLGQIGLALSLGQHSREGHSHGEQLPAVGIVNGRQKTTPLDYSMRDQAKGVRK